METEPGIVTCLQQTRAIVDGLFHILIDLRLIITEAVALHPVYIDDRCIEEGSRLIGKGDSQAVAQCPGIVVSTDIGEIAESTRRFIEEWVSRCDLTHCWRRQLAGVTQNGEDQDEERDHSMASRRNHLFNTPVWFARFAPLRNRARPPNLDPLEKPVHLRNSSVWEPSAL